MQRTYNNGVKVKKCQNNQNNFANKRNSGDILPIVLHIVMERLLHYLSNDAQYFSDLVLKICNMIFFS